MRRAVEDVMTRDVVCAHEGTPYKELVRLLASRRVSAVPVIDGRRHVLGVVSEADLLLKQDQPTRPAVRLLSVLRRRKDRAKAQAIVAAELMSRPAITIDPGRRWPRRRGGCTPSGQAAAGDRRCGPAAGDRQPGRSAEVLPAFRRGAAPGDREDVIFGDLFMAPSRFDVHVQDGVVVLQGCCVRRSLIPTVVRAVEGVVQVVNRLGLDDLSSPVPESLARPAL